MNAIDWIILGIAAVAIAGIVALSFHRGHHEWLTARFAYRSGLAIPPENEAAVGARLGLRERINAVGCYLGAAAGWIIGLPRDTIDPSPQFLFALAGGLAGVAVAIAATSRLLATSASPDRPLFARSTSVSLRDYSSGFERNGTRVVVALSVVALAALLVVATTADASLRSFSTPAMIFVAAAVASLALFEVRGRQIVARGQRASSESELAFDDALRAREMTDLVVPALVFGIYGTTFAVVDIIIVLTSFPPDSVLRPILLAVIAIAIVCGFIAKAIQPQQHYLRALWPKGQPSVAPLPAAQFHPVDTR